MRVDTRALLLACGVDPNDGHIMACHVKAFLRLMAAEAEALGVPCVIPLDNSVLEFYAGTTGGRLSTQQASDLMQIILELAEEITSPVLFVVSS